MNKSILENQDLLEQSLSDLMVKIPDGSIALNDDRIKRKWSVKINSFQIAKFPVTQKFYEEITNKSPSIFKNPKNPVESASWEESIHFCNLLSKRMNLEEYYKINTDSVTNNNSNGFRLPSEAEWEFACRAGNNNARYGELNEIAWHIENSEKQPHPVGEKHPNDWGLYDMLGNVWEWCSDIYDEEVYGKYRIFRGGGWYDKERGCLATNRRRSHPTLAIDDLGFRIARSI